MYAPSAAVSDARIEAAGDAATFKSLYRERTATLVFIMRVCDVGALPIRL
jgi:hypothetical protein